MVCRSYPEADQQAEPGQAHPSRVQEVGGAAIQQSWTRDNFLASRQRQRVNGIELQGQEKIKNVTVSVFRLSSHNEYTVVMMQ